MTRPGASRADRSPLDQVPLDRLPMAELRAVRMGARRALEVAQLRARHAEGTPAFDLESGRARVEELTQELIRRYAADLSLVDSLLAAPYPRGGGGADSRGDGERR